MESSCTQLPSVHVDNTMAKVTCCEDLYPEMMLMMMNMMMTKIAMMIMMMKMTMMRS